jgi:ATP-dependent DNA helicase RecG
MSLIPDDSLTRLKQRFGSRFQKFTALEVQALVTADLEGWVDNARMRQITSEHASDITRLLQKLVSMKILTQDGQGRWTRYSLPSESDSVHKELDSVHKELDSVHKELDSVHKIEIPDNEWDGLIKTAEFARQNKRLSHKEIESTLLKLCESHWLTRRQLAVLLGRNADALRSRFLTMMVGHGLLRLRYPEKPNRADQAYTKNTNTISID